VLWERLRVDWMVGRKVVQSADKKVVRLGSLWAGKLVAQWDVHLVGLQLI
jgi:hypothetical protein